MVDLVYCMDAQVLCGKNEEHSTDVEVRRTEFAKIGRLVSMLARIFSEGIVTIPTRAV